MIQVNGKEATAAEGMSVAAYLAGSGYRVERIAVEYNGEILPKTGYESVLLKDGDVLEVVSFVGGG